MCGIMGAIGDSAVSDVLTGLKKLQYRGYDSCGVACKMQGKIESFKTVGTIENLINKTDVEKVNSRVCIGHTRWATHGGVSEKNCHPHISPSGRFAIVHNGIIENFVKLKEQYFANVQMPNDTDSVIIAMLLDKLWNGDMMSTFKSVLSCLTGSYAVVVLDRMSDSLYFARHFSPLVVGVGKGKTCVSSDVSGLIGCDHVGYIPDDCYGFIDSSIHVFDKNDRVIDINLQFYKHDKSRENSHPHYMLSEIYEIPSALKRTHENLMKSKIVLPKNVSKVIIFACGTSYHSGLLGKMYIESIAGLPTECIIASESDCTPYLMGEDHLSTKCNKNNCDKGYCKNSKIDADMGDVNCRKDCEKYVDIGHQENTKNNADIGQCKNCEKCGGKTVGIFISQSGETADTISALLSAKKRGMYTVAITNVHHSTITTIADEVVLMSAGAEICVASTKAYTTQVFVLLTLAFALRKLRCGGNLQKQLSKTTAKSRVKEINSKDKSGVFCLSPNNADKIQILSTENSNVVGTKKYSGEFAEINFADVFAESDFPNDGLRTLFGLDIDRIARNLDGIESELKGIVGLHLVGKGADYVSAMEGGLKIKEVTYKFTDAYPCGELKHGTLSLIDENSVVIAIATDESTLKQCNNSIDEISSRGGRVIAVTASKNVSANVFKVIHVPKISQNLMPIVAILPMFLIAYRLSVALGINPDMPKNLAKSVTVQ